MNFFRLLGLNTRLFIRKITTVTMGTTTAAAEVPVAYIVNSDSGSVSVINTATQEVLATVPVGSYPEHMAITPDGTQVYVVNFGSANVSVIDTATQRVLATIQVGSRPTGIAFTPDGTKGYVVNYDSHNVSVIDTAIQEVVATIPVGEYPRQGSVHPGWNEGICGEFW
jgi:YVTN family beta-propeller protein